MSTAPATAPALRGPKFRAWEFLLLVGAAPVFLISLAMYVTDYPILRRYVFQVERDAGEGQRVGSLATATGRVRRQRAIESEFLNLTVGDILENQDTVVTDPGVTASIALDDGGKIELSNDTMVKLAFDTGISIGGITRQTSVQLVTGSVSGQTKEQKIVVKTVTGKTTTLTNAVKQVVREQPVVPKKVEMVAAAVPVEVIEAKLPPPMELPKEEKKEEKKAEPLTPPPPPKPKTLPATLTDLTPPSGARLAPASGTVAGRMPVNLAFTTSRANGKYRIRLKSSSAWIGGSVIDERVEAKSGRVSLPVTLDKPGPYEWSIEDLDAESPLGTQQFELTTDFEAIVLLEPTISGLKSLNNLLEKDMIRKFPGILLRWKPNADSKGYEVQFFSDPAGKRLLASNETDAPQLIYGAGKLTSSPIYYRVYSTLKSGFRTFSAIGKAQVTFLPPVPARPLNGATIEQPSGGRAPILLTWRHTNFTTKYEVQVSTTPAFNSIVDAAVTTENFRSFRPKSTGTYYWRLRSYGGDVKSNFSEAQNFVVR